MSYIYIYIHTVATYYCDVLLLYKCCGVPNAKTGVVHNYLVDHPATCKWVSENPSEINGY